MENVGDGFEYLKSLDPWIGTVNYAPQKAQPLGCIVAVSHRECAESFAVLEPVRGRVMTNLLMSGAKASSEAAATEHKIAELRLNLMSARPNQEIANLRDAIFLAEQSRSITPEISILKTNEHQTITLPQFQGGLS